MILIRNSVENPSITTRKTPESAMQEGMPNVTLSRGAPPVLPSGPVPPFRRFRKAIRSREDVTSWYHSQSSTPIDEPSSSSHHYSDALSEGDLFMNVFSGGIQAWVWNGKAWVPIKEGDPHPSIDGYCVSFLRDGEPSWVTKKTMVTYRGKRRR